LGFIRQNRVVMKNEPPVFSSGAGAAAPLNFLQSLLGSIRPPDWLVDEIQNRVVLFLNHVLMQEKSAQDRLRRQKGKPVRIQWGDFHLTLAPTAAGLLERCEAGAKSELSVTLTQRSALDLAQRVLAGEKPGVDIQGDVQLAAEVAWLVDNVRWDVEEDLSRVVGDATAHTLARAAQSAGQAIKAFAARVPAAFPSRKAQGDASVPPSADGPSA
jgi:ubiquinone biosynthesis accessory factor UbiJ